MREGGDHCEGVVVGAGRAAVDYFAVAGAFEEFVGAGDEVGGVCVEASGEFEPDVDG
ncbi:hypothetical protein [Streptomyces sp. NBC_01092]|uniref:hypothetical protein n=1 Tax=Streptomyces sp. NBC_01092 TaxID=2903748 RepID=UPI00386C3D09|nr:hypothetical protein OG254_39105 [Streptomyces sp. NBC_01092]